MRRNAKSLGIAGWRPARLDGSLPRNTLSYPVRRSLELFENLFDGNHPRVLDVGCGNGSKLSCFNSLVGQSVGIDLPIEVSQIANPDLARVAGSADSFLPFPDNSFDAVTNFHVLEHLWEREMSIDEMYRVLKPSGWLLLITPNRWRVSALYSNLLLKLFKSDLPHPMNPDHTFEYAGGDLRRAFEKSRFSQWRVESMFLGLTASFGDTNYWMGLERVPSWLDRFCTEWLVVAQKQT